MTISTVTVSIAVHQITGVALPAGRVSFQLSGMDVNSGIVAPAPTQVLLDDDGLGTVALWPNSLGTQGTRYGVTIHDRNGNLQFTGFATVPESNCNLHAILNLAAPASVDDAEAAALEAQASAAEAATSAASAATAAAAAVAVHTGDTTAAHAASAISFTPSGGMTATDAQAAILEAYNNGGGGGGGGGATNLAYSASPTNGTVTSDTGTDATLTLADATNAGLMAPAQHTKVAGIADGATANATDAQLRDRSTHTGTQAASTISDPLSFPVSTAQQTALDLKANLASPALTGTPTAPTAAAATNTTQIATTAFVRTEVANLVAASPGALDTLDELAAALGDDPNFATTIATSLGTKEVAANKDASGGYAGLTLLKLNLRNAANTITSFFTTAATVARTWTMPDKDGTVAMTSDITAAAVGLSNVTNDTQTKAAIVPNTAPTSGQLLAGNAGGTAYAPVSMSGDAALASTGALTIANSAVTLAKQADVATSTVFYRKTAGTGAPEVQTLATLKTDLGLTGTNTGDQTAASLQGTGSSASDAGFRGIPQNSNSAAYTTVLADSGKHIFHPAADTNARTFTIDSNANVAYPVGTAITFVNETSQAVTIAITSDTLTLAGSTTTGSRTLAQNGVATALKVTSTKWIISGSGLT